MSPKDLRYIVGAILSDGVSNEENNEDENLLTQRGFKVAKLPAVKYALNTTFPFKNTLSIFLAVGRVYPKLDTYIKVSIIQCLFSFCIWCVYYPFKKSRFYLKGKKVMCPPYD